MTVTGGRLWCSSLPRLRRECITLGFVKSTFQPCFTTHLYAREAIMHNAMLQGHGLTCYCVFFRAIAELKARGYVKGGQQVAIVQSGRQPIWRSASTHAIQVRYMACRHCFIAKCCCALQNLCNLQDGMPLQLTQPGVTDLNFNHALQVRQVAADPKASSEDD